METGRMKVSLVDLVTSIARVVDIMSPAVGGHHLQVAYLAYRIGEALGLSVGERNELLVAGLLHDIGAFSLHNRLDIMAFEDLNPGRHARAGYYLLREFKPFSSAARLVKYHHVPWENGRGSYRDGETIPQGSHILHLADRVAVKITKDRPVLAQVNEIREAIQACGTAVFVPEHVRALMELTGRDYIWLEVASDFIESILRQVFFHREQELSFSDLLDFSRLVCRLIDFKSEFTATHSSGVAATAVALAKLAGFSGQERRMVEIAAYLHDLGKLSIPSEIIEKKDKLSEQEWFVMRSHVYYTYQALAPFEMLSVVNAWGALHQERLNGTGYPFGYTEDALPLGARLIAVADVFTALTEDRPYRKGLGRADAANLLHLMADNGELDQRLVDMVAGHFEDMNRIRQAAQRRALDDYNLFASRM
ncbi:MAG: HD domain-containing phosphohydrolase [Thermodesulfobacteriota bacterium]